MKHYWDSSMNSESRETPTPGAKARKKPSTQIRTGLINPDRPMLALFAFGHLRSTMDILKDSREIAVSSLSFAIKGYILHENGKSLAAESNGPQA